MPNALLDTLAEPEFWWTTFGLVAAMAGTVAALWRAFRGESINPFEIGD